MPNPLQTGQLDYFGRLSWGNFLDWLITFCLGGIIALATLALGGVRPETHLPLLVLFTVLLGLHGLWFIVDKETPKRISHIPLLFLPFVLWIAASAAWWSPAPWRGWEALIYTLEAFVFFWVLVNNVRTRAHLWVLLILALAPGGYAIFNGFFQFFQNPERVANAFAAMPIKLSPDVIGHATGTFADPNNFAVFLLMWLPALLIAGMAPRLPMVLRLFCFYVALMFLLGLLFANVLWPVLVLVPMVFLTCWFAVERVTRRLFFTCSVIGVAGIALLGFYLVHPPFERMVDEVVAGEGNVLHPILWGETVEAGLSEPLKGLGSGAFQVAMEQSSRTGFGKDPGTPHNDYLLVFAELGVVGLTLFLLPAGFVIYRAYRTWRDEPFLARRKEEDGLIMPSQKFFLSIALAAVLSLALCQTLTFVFQVPALLLHATLLFSILAKTSFNRELQLPAHGFVRVGYFLVMAVVGWAGYQFAAPRLQAQGLELNARQYLDQLVEKELHISGDAGLLDDVAAAFTRATELDPGNANAWIGRSEAERLKFLRHPAEFEVIGDAAGRYAEKAVEVSEDYWRASAQLGIARALSGERQQAEEALQRALELAPNNSNAHYYWAAFTMRFPERQEEALAAVRRALTINPDNESARRLEQKLLSL
ncbi:MAG: O-antigen ligase family protein [Opitutales bacterium]